MAKNLDRVNVLTDTFNAWMLRTNDIIDLIRTEVITANTAGGVTGSSGTPYNARLWGTFTANTLTADILTIGAGVFTANSTDIYLGPVRLNAGGTFGNNGQVLTSTGTGVQWSAAVGSGTVTNIISGNGISFSQSASASSITSTGTINVRAGGGIVVNSDGVSVNTSYLNTELNPIRLLGRTWANPGPIGESAANTVTATEFNFPGVGSVASLTRTGILIEGTIAGATGSGTDNVAAGAFKVIGNAEGAAGVAVIQVVDNSASQTEWGRFKAYSNGHLIWTGLGGFGTTGTVQSEFPANTRLLFQQNTAPVGWTMETNPGLNDRALRLVVGGENFTPGYGSGRGFSILFGGASSANTVSTALTLAQMPAHYHVVVPPAVGDQDGFGFTATGSSNPDDLNLPPAPSEEDIYPYQTRSVGGPGTIDSENGTPVGVADGVAAGHSHPLNINVNYVDVIIAQKN